jgi:hypothetical protein
MTPNSPPLFVLLYDSKFTCVICLVIWPQNSPPLFVLLYDSKFTSVVCLVIWLKIHLRYWSCYMTPNSSPLFVLLYDSQFTRVVCLVTWLIIHLRYLSCYMLPIPLCCLSRYVIPNSPPLLVLFWWIGSHITRQITVVNWESYNKTNNGGEIGVI